MKSADQLGAIRELALALLGEVESLTAGEESAATPSEGGGGEGDFYELIRAYEIFLIRRALLRARGNQARAARLLRLKPSTLHHKIKLYAIDLDPKATARGVAADACRSEPCPRSHASP
jgi:DNA-binding NtrC family response regulator